MSLSIDRRSKLRVLICAAALSLSTLASVAAYRVGDTVSDFSFVARQSFQRPDGVQVPAGTVVRLSDFAGSIVFLEWFAVWCPFCVAAVPQVDGGIVDHYREQGGNPYGVPVVHIAVNQEHRSFYQTQTDSFVARHGFGITVNDYDATSVNRVRFQFQSTGQPIFVVINGVTDSSTHKPWEVLVNHLGYGETDFNQELRNFRARIDQVQPAAIQPVLAEVSLVGSTCQFLLALPPGRTYRVQGSYDLENWETLQTLQGSSEPVLFQDLTAPANGRYYRVVSP